MFYKEEKKRWVENELAKFVNEHAQLTHYQQRVMRGFFEKEFEDVWKSRDYVYGQDEGGSPAGSRY